MEEILLKEGYTKLEKTEYIARRDGGYIVKIKLLDFHNKSFNPRIIVTIVHRRHGVIDSHTIHATKRMTEYNTQEELKKVMQLASTYVNMFIQGE